MSAEGLPGLTPGRERKREGLKVGTILSKIFPEVARGSACRASCLSARDLFQPFEKSSPIVSDAASEAVLRKEDSTLRGERAGRGNIYSSVRESRYRVFGRDTAYSTVLPLVPSGGSR